MLDGMKTVIYARVSTSEQSCEMQLRELRDYAARRELEIIGEFVDTGWSGAKASRPELDRLMREARLRRFDVVLVWKLDRWGRSVAHCVRSIQELVSLGIRFLAATQNIDTDESNPMSQFILHIFAAVAELEREMIRERVVAGIRTAQLNGKSLGRPRRVFRRDQARALRASGMSWRKIAGTLGIPMSTVIDSCRDAEMLAQPTLIASSRKPSQSCLNQPEINRESTKNQPF
jgi:DNA invertase Pin-like site-specific DNA recombinase